MTAEAEKVLKDIRRKFGRACHFAPRVMGGQANAELGSSLPRANVVSGSLFFMHGAVGGPKWESPTALDHPERGLFAMRKEVNLLANLSLVKTMVTIFAPPILR